MPTDDQQVLVTGTASAPASFKIPGNGQIRPKSIFATFDGTSAAGAYVPAIKLLSDGGEIVGVYRTIPQVAAGASVGVSWFPWLDEAGSSSQAAGGSSPPSGPAGGDLASTYPNPTVVAVEETGGPTRLAFGSIPDGDFLQRSGSSLIGVASSASIEVTDGTHTVMGASEVNFTAGAVVSSGGAGIADVAVTAVASAFSGARIYRSTNQSIPNNTDTQISFDTVRYDVGGYTNLGAHPTRFTAPQTGYYLIGGSVAFPVGDYYSQIVILLNNNLVNGQICGHTTSVPAGNNNLVTNTIWKATGGDFFELDVVQSSGGSANCISAPPQCPEFWITLLGV